MNGFHNDLERETVQNDNYRKVLYTTDKTQLVLMALKPGVEIGMEVHEEHDQFFRIDAGTATFTIDGEVFEAGDGHAVIVPAGAEHNVENKGTEDVKLYTIYAPPEHPDGTLHETKEAAAEYEAGH